MDVLTYSPAMEKKPITRSVRLDADLVAGVEKLAEALATRNMPRGATWNDALRFILGFLDVAGYLSDPDRLIDANHEAARESQKPAKK